MKAFSKVGLLAAVALLATAAVATSAQAVTINPDNTPVSGTSDNMHISYGVLSPSCDTATMDGNTSLDSDRITDLALAFTDNCSVAGVGSLEVDCVGDVTLIADPAADDTGTLELNEGFQCAFTTPYCTITVEGPQTTHPKNTELNEGHAVLNANWALQATRSGSNWCGPASGTANFTAEYAMTPDNLTIDPQPADRSAHRAPKGAGDSPAPSRVAALGINKPWCLTIARSAPTVHDCREGSSAVSLTASRGYEAPGGS
jgi:hypothetical protein